MSRNFKGLPNLMLENDCTDIYMSRNFKGLPNPYCIFLKNVIKKCLYANSILHK